jgi:alpha-tubulin suppressor-like RCC1 family protein
VYAWGRGEHGRLGFGDDKSSRMVPLKVELLAGEDIVQVIDLDITWMLLASVTLAFSLVLK